MPAAVCQGPRGRYSDPSSLPLVFQALGTVSLAVIRYRVQHVNILRALFTNLKWLLLLTCFLGGISIHVSQALLCHLLGIDMSWGATAKEATETTFFKEIPTIAKKFKYTFVFCILCTATMVIFAGVGPVGKLIPYQWIIADFTAIFPLAILVGFHFWPVRRR